MFIPLEEDPFKETDSLDDFDYGYNSDCSSVSGTSWKVPRVNIWEIYSDDEDESFIDENEYSDDEPVYDNSTDE